MFEIFLILSISGFIASFFGIGEKPKPEVLVQKKRWELTDEAKDEKRYRRKSRECRTALFLIPTMLCFVPFVGAGLNAFNRCAFASQCTHEVYEVEVRQFSDQYATALYNPVKAAQSVPPNLKILFWAGMIFVYIQLLVWLIALRTLFSLWVHDTHRPSES